VTGVSGFIRNAIGKWALSLLFVCAMSQVCSGYSVLTHEEIVDLLWTDQVKPLLLKKYPGTSEDDLRVAHGYAYGGCLMRSFQKVCKRESGGDRFHIIRIIRNQSTINKQFANVNILQKWEPF
jgi:hypothetical protein